MKTALFCECKKEKNLPPLNKTLSVMVWSKEYVLSYIFEIKSSIFYLKEKNRSPNIKIQNQMSIDLNDLKNGSAKYFENT